VIVQPGTGYELLVSCLTLADRAALRRFDDAAIWRRKAETIDDGAVARTIRQIGREPWINLLGLAHALTERPTAEATLAAIEDADPREIVLALVGYYRRTMRLATAPDMIRAAVDGDSAAQKEFRRTSYPETRHWQASLVHLLGLSPEEIHAQLVATLRSWYERAFAPEEGRLAEIQETDAGVVRELVGSMELDAVLERVAPGITFAREVGQTLLVLVPDAVIRPAILVTDHGSAMLVVYPAGSQVEDPSTPPERLVRVAKALADNLRLRALRELREGPMTVTDLAGRLGVPRTSLHHHVQILLDAGLLTLSVDDTRWGHLELRPEGLSDIGRLAEHFVLGRPGGIPTPASPAASFGDAAVERPRRGRTARRVRA
jgi:DNA-binding transcriptional ArsR family regulator